MAAAVHAVLSHHNDPTHVDVHRLETEAEERARKAPWNNATAARQEAGQEDFNRGQGDRMVSYSLFQTRQQEEEASVLRKGSTFNTLTSQEQHRVMVRAKMRQTSKVENAAHISKEAAAGVGYETTEMVLEEVLDTRSKIPIVHVAKERFGIYRFEDAAALERARRKAPGYKHRFPRLRRIVESPNFDFASGVLVMVNGIFIGFQASAAGERSIQIMEHAFIVLFVLEIILRVLVDSWLFFASAGNVLDFMVVVFTGVVPVWLLAPLGTTGAGMQVARIFSCLRVLRLLRVVKILRTLHFMRDFWLMVRGIIDVSATLLWTVVMLFVMSFMFSIFCIYLLGGKSEFRDDELAIRYFADVPTAMLTIFEVVLLDGWTEIARPFMRKSSMALPMFVGMIMVITLVLLNLITAIIIKNAFVHSEADEEVKAYDQKQKVLKDIEDLCEIFHEIDIDGNGTLSYDEYREALRSNEACIDKFRSIGITTGEQVHIWRLICDLDGASDEISIDTFASTMHAIQGQALAKDSFAILRRMYRTNAKIERLKATYMLRQREANEMKEQARVLKESVGNLMAETADFIEVIGGCIPSDPAPRQKGELEKFERRMSVLSQDPSLYESQRAGAFDV